MDKDRIAGSAHQVKGAVKETIGKVTGDAKTEADGAAEKTAGKVQNAVGGVKDAVRDVLKKYSGNAWGGRGARRRSGEGRLKCSEIGGLASASARGHWASKRHP